MASSATNSAANAAFDGLRDIKPPVVIGGWDWLAWLLVALLVATALAALAWWIFRKRPPVAPPPEEPPHLRARRELESALALLSQPKPFAIAVSDTLRRYLESRFALHAPERTTEEFLLEVQRSPQLQQPQKELLAFFLKRCDLVKFARYEPTQVELLDVHRAALHLVEDTEPRPLPEHAESPDGPSPGRHPTPSTPPNRKSE